MKFNKLVRDRIPEIIIANGDTPITHIADDAEYRQALRTKLREEVDEFIESEDVKELADILEVVYAFANDLSVGIDEIESIRREKAEKRGAFHGRIILEETN